MDSFLQSVERQAYRIALIGLGQHEDALDIVQEAMLRLVSKYSNRPKAEWKPLFYTILYNQIRSLQRKRSLHKKWFGWLPGRKEDKDSIDDLPDHRIASVEHTNHVQSAYTELESVLQELPLRQQQAFLLRAWEEMSVAETAQIMKCSEGSVKTHYSRAVNRLRQGLGDHWP